MSFHRHQETVPPRLMVQVKTQFEVAAALAGGAQMLDFLWQSQEDSRPARISPLCQLIGLASQKPWVGCSVSLGRLYDFPAPSLEFLPEAARWVRFEIDEVRHHAEWKIDWILQRQRVEDLHRRSFRWLALAFADHKSMDAPDPLTMLTAAVETGCSGLLLDVGGLSGVSLCDLMSPVAICDLAARAREQRLPLFVGGNVTPDDADWLCSLEVDVILMRDAIAGVPLESSRPHAAQSVADFNDALLQALASEFAI